MEPDEKHREASRKLQFIQQLVSPDKDSTADVVLSFFDDASKAAAFQYYWETLKRSSERIDLGALRVCIQLLPPPDQDVSFSEFCELQYLVCHVSHHCLRDRCT